MGEAERGMPRLADRSRRQQSTDRTGTVSGPRHREPWTPARVAMLRTHCSCNTFHPWAGCDLNKIPTRLRRSSGVGRRWRPRPDEDATDSADRSRAANGPKGVGEPTGCPLDRSVIRGRDRRRGGDGSVLCCAAERVRPSPSRSMQPPLSQRFPLRRSAARQRAETEPATPPEAQRQVPEGTPGMPTVVGLIGPGAPAAQPDGAPIRRSTTARRLFTDSAPVDTTSHRPLAFDAPPPVRPLGARSEGAPRAARGPDSNPPRLASLRPAQHLRSGVRAHGSSLSPTAARPVVGAGVSRRSRGPLTGSSFPHLRSAASHRI